MSPTSHPEIERKYEAAPDVKLPAPELAGVDGVSEVERPDPVELEATYHDTADLRLLRAGITLRRRTGGADAGWHLKLPETLDTRLELRRPLGRSARRPRSLTDLVLSTTRGRRLSTVAVTHTRRTVHRLLGPDGRTLAEIADDAVNAAATGGEPTAWRELEVEVTLGHETLLDTVGEVLVSAGATPSTAPSKLAVVLDDRLATIESAATDRPDEGTAGELVLTHLAEQRDELVALDPCVRRDVPDSVHKMRVAVRRLRSALRTYRRLLDRTMTDPLRDELKWLGGELGPDRDAEVVLARIERLLDDEPAGLTGGPARWRLRHTLGAEQRAARRTVLVQLRSKRYLELLDTLDHVVNGQALRVSRASKAAPKQVREALRRQHERWQRRVEQAVALDEAGLDEHVDTALHEVRKASKRVRYGAESAQRVLGDDAASLAAQMEDLQDLLGEYQDTVVTRAVLRRLADDAHAAGENTFTWGRLHAREQVCGAELATRFLDEIGGSLSSPDWLG